jgi:hypothetical protein
MRIRVRGAGSESDNYGSTKLQEVNHDISLPASHLRLLGISNGWHSVRTHFDRIWFAANFSSFAFIWPSPYSERPIAPLIILAKQIADPNSPVQDPLIRTPDVVSDPGAQWCRRYHTKSYQYLLKLKTRKMYENRQY